MADFRQSISTKKGYELLMLSKIFSEQKNSKNIYFWKCQKADEIKKKKKSKLDEQTLKELNSAHHSSKAKYQLVQTSYTCSCHIIFKHFINRAKSVSMGELILTSVV